MNRLSAGTWHPEQYGSSHCVPDLPLPESASSAIHSMTWRRLHGVSGPRPLICLIDFMVQRFVADAFVDTSIVCPATIARSVPKRQAEFFFGRLAARLALATSDVAGADILIGPSREPVWPVGLMGSITHTNQTAAAVVLDRSRCAGVGIDMEQVVSLENRQALLSTVISAVEWSYLQTVGLPADTVLTTAFSAKESLFKAAFPSVGRFFDFNAAEVVHVDAAGGRVSLILRETLSRELVAGRIVHAHFDFPAPHTVLTSVVL